MKLLAHRLINLADVIINLATNLNREDVPETKDELEKFIYAMEIIDTTLDTVGGEIRLLALERYTELVRKENQNVSAATVQTEAAASSSDPK